MQVCRGWGPQTPVYGEGVPTHQLYGPINILYLFSRVTLKPLIHHLTLPTFAPYAIILCMARPLVSFSGINFLETYITLAPDICSSVNSCLSFTKSGCLEWGGLRRKDWIDTGSYIERPILRSGGSTFSLYLLIKLMSGLGVRSGIGGVIATNCGSATCVNPEHFVEYPSGTSIASIYPHLIRDGEFRHNEEWIYCVTTADWSFGKTFHRFVQVAEYLGVSKTFVTRYLKTGRLLYGKWRITKYRVELNYLDMETMGGIYE